MPRQLSTGEKGRPVVVWGAPAGSWCLGQALSATCRSAGTSRPGVV